MNQVLAAAFELAAVSTIILKNAGLLICAFAFIHICNNVMGPVGGAAYALLNIPQHFRYIGGFYRLLTEWPLRLSFMFTFVSYLLSASGCVLPLYVMQLWWPQLLASPWVLWGTLLGALSITLNIMHRAHLMQFYSIDEFLEAPMLSVAVKKISGFETSQIKGREKMQLARSVYADVMAVDLLRLLACFAVVQFSGCSLGVIHIKSVNSYNPQNEVENVLIFMRIISGTALRLDGPIGFFAATFYGMSLFFFMSFFVSLTSRMVDEPPTSRPGHGTVLADIELSTEEIVKNPATEAPSERTSGHTPLRAD